MGGVCCGPRLADTLAVGAGAARNYPLSELRLQDVVSQGTSVAILGPKAVGKTLLYLRLTYPQVDVSDLTSITTETETLHVDLFGFTNQTILLWDISGNLLSHGATEVINTLHIAGIIYVISMLDTAPSAIAKHRRYLEQLVASPVAMLRKFLVIFNTFGAFDEGAHECRVMENRLKRGLDLERIISSLGPSRFNYIVGNVKDGVNEGPLSYALETLLLKLNQ